MKRSKVILKTGRDASAKRRHPWIFSGGIERMTPEPNEGDEVEVFSAEAEMLGLGHFSTDSIAIKLFSFGSEKDSSVVMRKHLTAAKELRKNIGLYENEATNAFRLVNAEGDSLPGLVIDIYGQTAVMQCHSEGMYRSRELVAENLKAVCGDRIRAIYVTRPAPQDEARDKGEYLFGAKESGEIREHGHRFSVDWETGQKTGYFLDQRENRKLVEQYSKNRTVLDAFSYAGGFSVYALAGGAKKVVSVDVSKVSADLAPKNVKTNFPSASYAHVDADCFNYLEKPTELFDLIVLDPPAFAKHKGALSGALPGYRRINYLALAQLPPRGMLFTFSCSHFVTSEQFRQTVLEAAMQTGRPIQVLHELGAPPCHPVSITHPEGRYLKGLVLSIAD